jgi:hypothetical protein
MRDLTLSAGDPQRRSTNDTCGGPSGCCITGKWETCPSARSYAASYMQRVLPRLVLLLGNVAAAIIDAVAMLGTNSQRVVPGRSQPRKPNHVKPHPSCSDKG